MGERMLSIAWKLMVFDLFIVISLGVMLMFNPEFIPTIEDWIGNYPALADSLKLTYGWLGLLVVWGAIMSIAVSITSFRNGEKWSWYALLVTGLVGLIGTMALAS